MHSGKWTFKSFSFICISAPTISNGPDELDSFIMVLLIKSPIKSMSCGSVRILLLITESAGGWSSFWCLILDDSASSALRTDYCEHFYTVSHEEMKWNFKTALKKPEGSWPFIVLTVLNMWNWEAKLEKRLLGHLICSATWTFYQDNLIYAGVTGFAQTQIYATDTLRASDAMQLY